MAVRTEDRFPLTDIWSQTPNIDESCQWALFFRNHDELTLEMVTDEERDYMYRAYAHENRMRINLGIRRRLAPLLGNNRRTIELMNGLLFSLPGTPFSTTATRSGMGDNVYLRRPRRGSHPDAVERRHERRLLTRQPPKAHFAGGDRSRVPLPNHQRRSARGQPPFALVVDAKAHRSA